MGKKVDLFCAIKTMCLQFCGLIMISCIFPAISFAVTEPISGIIIGFGDSLTEGCDVYGGDCGWERTGVSGYEIELMKLLQNSDRDYVVKNFGHGGETAKDGVFRIGRVLAEPCNEGAEYVLILEGTNDLLHGARGLDVKYYLGLIIDQVVANGMVPLLATITPDKDPEHSYKDIPLMNEYIRDLALEKDVTLVELYNQMEPYWGKYTPGCYGDLLHPNVDGFQVMGDIWFESLATLIPAKHDINLNWLLLLLKSP
jgi:lysophospholipase L1-like esterase